MDSISNTTTQGYDKYEPDMKIFLCKAISCSGSLNMTETSMNRAYLCGNLDTFNPSLHLKIIDFADVVARLFKKCVYKMKDENQFIKQNCSGSVFVYSVENWRPNSFRFDNTYHSGCPLCKLIKTGENNSIQIFESNHDFFETLVRLI
ncbi:MAG: hypothetical protein K1X68_06705 [Saprospiraceae bacterium]|nr:hypothetical protein [Saprospiraceae bacterium]HMW39726.1 hypothetical protein [Saprospiraceae bacterium]HMX88234.1 hypothetical protein [Saprospiraceae bacterium]HMZ40695.1 hypothetical protein [Saprospiraceae bacterium]HNA65692.1 hypothetical protein [Saprospiraceae bacterium]